MAASLPTAYATSGNRLGVNLLLSGTTLQCPLGTVVQGHDTVSGTAGEFIYVQANTNMTEGQAAVISLLNKCDLASSAAHANSGQPVGFVPNVVVANGDFFWLKISGTIKAKAAAVAANAKVMLSATAGTVDDAAIAGSQVLGALFSTADGTPAAGFAYLVGNRMHVQGQIT